MNAGRVHLVMASADGGVGAHVQSLVPALLERGWTVAVSGTQSTDDLFGFAERGAIFTPIEIRSAASSLQLARKLRAATARADVVHAHGLRATVTAALARRRPLVSTWHNLVLDEPPSAEAAATQTSPAHAIKRVLRTAVRDAAGWAAESLAARSAMVTMGASADLVEQARRRGSPDARLFEVATPSALPHRASDEVRREFGVPANAPLVVTVARLHPQKGLDVLIAAAAHWRATHPGVTVLIAGDGPLRPALEQQIEQLDAPVRLLGRRSDVPDLLGAADVVALPSRWEARSLAAQEAMRLGRPLVVTAVGGLPELVGDAAVQIAPDNIDELRDAVSSLLRDRSAAAELGARAAQRAAAWPTEADNADMLDTLYRQAVAARH